MKPEHLEVLSALFDGERVDPSLLAEALADPRAADVLAEFASLRLLARELRAQPSDGFYGRMEGVLRRKGLRDRVTRLLLPAMAAGLVIAAGVAGFMAGSLFGPTGPMPAPRAATVARVPAPSFVAPGPVPDAGPAATPAPRRVPESPPPSDLRLRFTHWQDTAASPGHSAE